MRIELAGGSVRRLISVWRDSHPLPGEKPPRRIAVEHYGLGMSPPTPVASHPLVDTPRWQQFLVDEGPEGDRLLEALRQGPVKPTIKGDAWLVDLDRIDRAARKADEWEPTDRGLVPGELFYHPGGRVVAVGGRPVRRTRKGSI